MLDQDAKGFRPIESLISYFESADFLAAGDVQITHNGEVVTDVDVIAYKEGKLFLGQAKVGIEPDTIYEVWKAEMRLEHAAEQLRKSISYQDELVKALTKKYPGALINVEEVFSFILTNIRQVTEMTIDGFPVVDLPYVNRSRSMTKLSAWCGLGGWAAHI